MLSVKIREVLYNFFFKKQKYKISFYKFITPNWYMICTRTKFDCYKVAFKHLLKGHAILFTVNTHNNTIYQLKK